MVGATCLAYTALYSVEVIETQVIEILYLKYI